MRGRYRYLAATCGQTLHRFANLWVSFLMIFGLSGTPKTLPITLAFGSGKKVTVTAAVRSAGDEMHAGH